MDRMIPKALLATTLILASTAAVADSMRCGGALIQRGDSITKLMRECGEPIYQEEVQNRRGAVIGTRYFYDSGRWSGERKVFVSGGEVQSISRVD